MPKKVWAEHPDLLWDLFDVVESSTETCTIVSCSTGISRTVPSSSLISVDPSHLENNNDLCAMNCLHEAPLVDLVRRRYLSDTIFSSIGSSDILVSLNPYRQIPGLFDNMGLYYRPLRTEDQSSPPPPHIYGTANIALRSLGSSIAHRSNQSIIISGESGAGKTEASKAVVNFLIHCDSLKTDGTVNEYNDSCERIKRVIKSSTAIFEAFGNSKTIKNENSSRFGKFIKINYSDDSRIISAETETFLLESSRLVAAGIDERNYHIFYMMLSALGGQLGLKPAEHYEILTQGKCTTLIDTTADAMAFEQLMMSFRDLEFSPDDISNIWTLLSTILNLGNLKLLFIEEGKEVQIDESSSLFESLSAALGVVPMLFKSALTTSRVQVGNRASVNVKILAISDVENNVKGMIKWIYNKLFEWLVRQINGKFKNETISYLENTPFIGILDIFGFEILAVNSLEQLCINYTNERLQQEFNERVFVLEQEEYKREGLDWEHITFTDNQNQIDCIAKHPTGLLQQLEEYGSLNRKGDNPDAALLAQFHQTNEKVSNSSFVKSRFKDQYFTVRHYAGDVVYDVNGFVSKNNFALTEDLTELLVCTSHPFLANLFENSNSRSRSESAEASQEADLRRGGGSAKKRVGTISLSFQFRQQVDKLMLQLKSTASHYIKCIKPNSLKTTAFDAPLVVEQLRHCGIMEVVRIRREGFPIRETFKEFLSMCSDLRKVTDIPSTIGDDKEICRYISEKYLSANGYCIGIEKIYLRLLSVRALERLPKRIEKHASEVISKFLTIIVRCKREIKSRLRREEEERERLERIRLAEEAERKRIADEAERKRISDEVEKRRIADEAEQKRIAEEKRIADEAERKRIADEAEQKLISDQLLAAEEAERKRIAQDAFENSMKSRLVKFIRPRIRRDRLYKSILMLHNTLKQSHGPSEEVVAEAIRRVPDILEVLDRRSGFNSVLHTLAFHGNLHTASFLPMRIESLLSKNSCGTSCFLANICSLSMKDIVIFFEKLFSHRNLPEPLPSFTAIMELDDSILHSGILDMSNDESKWRTSFVEVSCGLLVYYADDTNTSGRKELPLRGATLSRGADTTKQCLLLKTPEYTKSRIFGGTKVGKVKMLRFPNEKSLIAWYIAISAAIKLPDPGKTISTRFSKPFSSRCTTSGIILNSDTYKDKNNNSPLHLLADMTVTDGKELQIASWLLDRGLDGNSVNVDGNTPAKIAARRGNIALLRMLAVKCNLRCSVDGNWSAILAELASAEHRAIIEKIPRELKPSTVPRKFGNFSYITINFLLQITSLDVSKRPPYLSVSLFNINVEYLEDPYIIPFPATYTSSAIFWQQHWHMQTPLEAIPAGAYIVIESSYFSFEEKEETMKKFVVPMDEFRTAGESRRRLPHQDVEEDCIDFDVFIENAMIL